MRLCQPDPSVAVACHRLPAKNRKGRTAPQGPDIASSRPGRVPAETGTRAPTAPGC